VPDTENIVKPKKTSQKGPSGSGKPKKTHASLKDEAVVENTQFEDLEPSTVSKEILSEINRAPCPSSSPLNLSSNKVSHTVHSIPLSLSSISLFQTAQSASVLAHTPVMAG